MNVTIVFYTNCLAPKPVIGRTLENAMKTACERGWNVVVSSHLPVLNEHVDVGVDFHHLLCQSPDKRNLKYLDTWKGNELEPVGRVKNYVTGILNYSFEAILTQIVHSISSVPDSDAIILWEHDVMYPEGYVDAMVAALDNADYAVYRDHVFLNDDGFFKPGVNFWYLSRYAARRKVLLECFGSKIELEDYEILEPVLDGLGDESGVDPDSDNYTVVDGPPVMDIRHGANASGQILVDDHRDSYDYWGDADQYIKLIMDSSYIDYVTSKPEVGYGLFISGQSFFL